MPGCWPRWFGGPASGSAACPGRPSSPPLPAARYPPRPPEAADNGTFCPSLFRRLNSVKLLVTGSSGLIGSEAVRYFDKRGARVFGIDNNLRADFFGPEGDTTWNLRRLQETCKHFEHLPLDIRDRPAMAR